MCGVFGIYSITQSADKLREQTHQGLAQLQHRGPDGWGTYQTEGIALGHTRLSIFDVAAGDQPMVTEHTALVYNGEIYNHYELRRELEADGVVFRTHCDTEVIQRLYERDGTGCLERLNGQFAFLLWDKREQTLVAARDRLGMRPLYVLEHEGSLYFSSEMKAFDAIFPGLREVEPEYLLEHGLLWNTLGSDTVYRNIRCLASGTAETFREARLQSTFRYYDIGRGCDGENHSQSYAEAEAEFIERLRHSVDLRLRSDVPVGAYLSGGIDSTVIAYLTKEIKQDRFRTFSVEFDDERYDEGYYQRLVSDAIGSQHESVKISHQIIRDTFMDAVYHTERPVFRTAPLPLYQLARKVRETDIKVVLTGEGADEILFGYDTFKELRILQQWNDGDVVNNAITQLYPHLNHYADPKKFGLMKMYYEGFLGSFNNSFAGLNIRMGNNKVVQNYLNKDWGVELNADALEARLRQQLPDNFDQWTLLQKNSYLEIKTLLQGYLLSSQGDRMALGSSIEGRYPFLDHTLVDYVFALPDDYKLQGFSQKHLLKTAFHGTIPREVVERPKRPYMAPDIAAFYQGDQLVDFAAELLSPEKLSEYGSFDTTMVERFLRKFRKGVPENVGYRDNMLFVFMLSMQACHHWIRHPASRTLDPGLCKVAVTESRPAAQ